MKRLTVKKYVKEAIKDIQKRFRENGHAQAYHDYDILCHEFKTEHSESLLEKEFNVWFCNGLNHPLREIRLVYSAYESFLSIIPVEKNSDNHHESYFNFGKADTNCEKEYNKEVLDMWFRLIEI